METDFFKHECFVGGSWTGATSRPLIPVYNPANGTEIGRVPDLGERETHHCISVGAQAFPEWAGLPANDRARFLRRIALILKENSAAIARILTLEQGKPISESEKEIIYASDYIEWYAEESRRIYGETIPGSSSEQRILVVHEPIGVCAGITPWNFPLAMVARKMGAALAAGCTFIARPASETPFSALALAAVCEQAELPAGVFNVITGKADVIALTLFESATVQKISFTGSTEVGKQLIERSAATVKKLTLELGGNAPFIVFDDAEIEKAVTAAIYAKYRNAGQSCIAVNRFLVHEKIAADFTERLAAASRSLHVGNGLDPDTDIGPLISPRALSQVKSLVKDALASGAQLVMGGFPNDDAGAPESLFVYPTILSGVTSQMRIWHEEIFGPVCTIQSFRTSQEALTLANDTHYGLASYLFTQNISRALSFAQGLRFGMVGINDSVLSLVQAPFGGIKQSGYGREGGRQGIAEYLNTKLIAIGL